MEKILFSRLSDTCDINQPFKIGKLHDLFFNSLYHLIFIFNYMSFFFKNDLPNCKNLQIPQNLDLSLSANYVSDTCSFLEIQ